MFKILNQSIIKSDDIQTNLITNTLLIPGTTNIDSQITTKSYEDSDGNNYSDGIIYKNNENDIIDLRLTQNITTTLNIVPSIYLYNDSLSLNTNILTFHKNTKYILNMVTLLGQFVDDISEVQQDTTNVSTIYFNDIVKLTDISNESTCLYLFDIKDQVASDLSFRCIGTNLDKLIRFNII